VGVFVSPQNIQNCQHLLLILPSTAHFCQHNLQNWLLLLLLAERCRSSNNIQANQQTCNYRIFSNLIRTSFADFLNEKKNSPRF